MEILSSPTFWGILVPAMSGVLALIWSKAAERESEWRKEKLRLYLSFVESLSGITASEKTPQNEIKFAKACNDLHALSSKEVINALHAYQDSMALSNQNKSSDKIQESLNKLVYEMRRDLKVKPKDIESQFEMRLWTSGIQKHL